jgi:hypothetical protein
MQERYIYAYLSFKLKYLLAILEADGHPSLDHYGNKRGGIPHP